MDEIYVDGMRKLEQKEENTFKTMVNNIPIESFRGVFIAAILIVFVLVWVKQLPTKALYWSFGIMGGILMMLGMQVKNRGADITEDEAKAMVMYGLDRKKKAGTKEFDGLNGHFNIAGPCRLDWSDLDPNKWEWLVSWYHRTPQGKVNYYTAAIVSKIHLKKIRALSVNATKYLGEELPKRPIYPAGITGAKNITYNVTPNQNQQPIMRYP